METVELIVGLDYPRWLSLGRLVRRCLLRLVKRTPVCNGNRESLRLLFSKESIIWWHFSSFKRKQVRMRKWHADPAGPRVLLFRSPGAVDGWLRESPPPSRQ
jgi:hypothetical protein